MTNEPKAILEEAERLINLAYTGIRKAVSDLRIMIRQS